MKYQKHDFKVYIINNSFIKISLSSSKNQEEHFSYAIDPDFEKTASITEVEEEYTTGSVKLKIKRSAGAITLYKDNAEIFQLNQPEETQYKENIFLFTPITLQGNEAVYGLGDQPAEPNLRGKEFELWGTDTYAYNYGSNPLYKNIPFFIVSKPEMSFGIFLDSSHRTYFNFQNGKSGFGTTDRDKTYYLFTGANASEVVEKYHLLTGTPDLPPLWALGYHQCRWSYFPEKRVRQIARKFRKLKIPCDAVYLDIDYMDGFRCFTWDKKLFPDLPGLIRRLRKQGFKTVVMINPGIKKDKRYKIWKSGMEAGIFCRLPDGSLFEGNVWPGKCNFPDFTHPDTRKWWEATFKDFLLETGIEGIWNDMNEPALYDPVKKVQTQRTFPDKVVHNYDGYPTDHTKAHNVYGMQMSRATNEAQQKHVPERRPFTITRSTFSGGQRYASVWTGDNVATWEHLKIANWQVVSLAVSGFSFAGSDIGGFVGDPDGELYIRWLQMAVFHPFFRTHSSKGFKNQEPWSYGDTYTELSRSAIQLRYRLLSYIYTAFLRYSRDKKPMLKPLYFDYPDDSIAIDRKEEFLFGEHLLVAPISDKGSRGRWTYFPEGLWYRNKSNTPIHGSKTHYTPASIDQIPFFIKGGAIIPWDEPVQYTGEKKADIQELHCYIGNTVIKSHLYVDNGENVDYKNNIYKLFTYSFIPEKNKYRVTIEEEGIFQPLFTTFRFLIYGLSSSVSVSIFADGKEIKSETGNFISFRADCKIKEIEIRLDTI